MVIEVSSTSGVTPPFSASSMVIVVNSCNPSRNIANRSDAGSRHGVAGVAGGERHPAAAVGRSSSRDPRRGRTIPVKSLEASVVTDAAGTKAAGGACDDHGVASGIVRALSPAGTGIAVTVKSSAATSDGIASASVASSTPARTPTVRLRELRAVIEPPPCIPPGTPILRWVSNGNRRKQRRPSEIDAESKGPRRCRGPLVLVSVGI